MLGNLHLSLPILTSLATLHVAAAARAGTCDSWEAAGCASSSQAGIALVQWKRTVKAVDTEHGEFESRPQNSSQAEQAEAKTANRESHSVPAADAGPSQSFSNASSLSLAGLATGLSANKTEIKPGGQDHLMPSQSEVPEEVSVVKALEALVAAPYPRMSANGAIEVAHAQSAESFSLSSAGEGGGLSGSGIAGGDDSELAVITGDDSVNSSAPMPPAIHERFEPFGYPGAGMLLELHMPETTLKELHSSSRGSLAQFLLEVRDELCKSVSVPDSRISILGIHGRYKRFDTGGLFQIHSEGTGHSSGFAHIDEEVVVRFEILPGWAEDPDPRQVLELLQDHLGSSHSSLMDGPLATVLVNATVSVSTPVGMMSDSHMVDRKGMTHMSAMAWPIGISAAFIGILIWLAAY